jgi:hypothetical protein
MIKTEFAYKVLSRQLWGIRAENPDSEAAKQAAAELAEYDEKKNFGRMGNWHYTYTGERFWPLDVRPEDIRINDIVYPLSHINRFNGGCLDPYSVAQHSIHVAELVPRQYALYALLHDAAEAYIGDTITPVKSLDFMRGFGELEERIMAAIAEAFSFHITPEATKAIKWADMKVLATEVRDLTIYGFFPVLVRENIQPLEETILPKTPDWVREKFLDMLNGLMA